MTQTGRAGTDAAAQETPANLVSLDLPDRAGLLIQRVGAAPTADHPGRLVERRSRAVVGGTRADLQFVEIHRGELARVALGLASLPHIRTIVLCPAGVSPARTALAFAVAGLLSGLRPDRPSVVTCAVRPVVGGGRVAIPHEVQVDAAGRAEYRVVWEVMPAARVPDWLEGLR